MKRSVLIFCAAALLAAPGLSAPALAEDELPSASSTDQDPVVAPEGTTTTSSQGNADGSRTVTTTDADGNVVEQHTVPGEPGPAYSTLEEVQAEIERQAQEDAEWLQGWDEDFPEGDDSDGGEPESAVPPPTSDWEAADDALIDMEEELRDLRSQHNDLLDQAAATEDLEEFDDLVEQAQQVFDEMDDLRDRYDDQRAEGGRYDDTDLEYVDPNALGAEIDELEDRLGELPQEIDEAATDEEAEALEQEAAEAARRLREAQGEYDQMLDENQEEALQRAADRHERATGHQGATQRAPTPPRVPHVGSGPSHRPRPRY